METEVEGLIGAGRDERSGERTTWRNGYRDRTLDTRPARCNCASAKLRQGSCFPPFLEARKSSEKGLVAVIQEAWIGGVSFQHSEDLVQAMGAVGDQQVAGFQAVQGDRRARPCLPRPAARRRVAVSVARRHLPEAARGRPHRVGRGNNRCRGQHRRPTRDRRAAYRPLGSRDLLVELSEEPDAARAAWRQTGDLRRP